ncbi:dihydropteroate synthase [Roseibacillus persicicus]|uniref:dihydropteroate synthase n=1 Tax=Roseibacillus persicicus TaxID=454148 RepID=UPI00398AD914
MLLRLRDRTLSWPRRGCVMGILNINDDSFSGDGKVDFTWAAHRAMEMIEEGADIVDVGAESARTNRKAISPAEEIERFLGFCKQWEKVVAQAKPRDNQQVWPPVLSANTWRPEVVAAVLEMGVELINDMSGLPDNQNALACAKSGAALLVMHSVGEPKVDHSHVRWPDVMSSMEDFFAEKLAQCDEAGLSREQVILDPGFGFAKSAQDDLVVLRDLSRLTRFDRPLLLPVGRKGFIGETLEIKEPADRDAATLGCVSAGHSRGAAIYRVHEVKGSFELLKVLQGLEQ